MIIPLIIFCVLIYPFSIGTKLYRARYISEIDLVVSQKFCVNKPSVKSEHIIAAGIFNIDIFYDLFKFVVVFLAESPAEYAFGAGFLAHFDCETFVLLRVKQRTVHIGRDVAQRVR